MKVTFQNTHTRTMWSSSYHYFRELQNKQTYKMKRGHMILTEQAPANIVSKSAKCELTLASRLLGQVL